MQNIITLNTTQIIKITDNLHEQILLPIQPFIFLTTYPLCSGWRQAQLSQCERQDRSSLQSQHREKVITQSNGNCTKNYITLFSIIFYSILKLQWHLLVIRPTALVIVTQSSVDVIYTGNEEISPRAECLSSFQHINKYIAQQNSSKQTTSITLFPVDSQSFVCRHLWRLFGFQLKI